MFTTGSPGSTATAERRRALLLELSREDGPIRRAHPMSFSPEVVEAYRDRGPKTLTRDLNALRKLGLVRLDEGGASWQPREQIQAFLPIRVESRQSHSNRRAAFDSGPRAHSG